MRAGKARTLAVFLLTLEVAVVFSVSRNVGHSIRHASIASCIPSKPGRPRQIASLLGTMDPLMLVSSRRDLVEPRGIEPLSEIPSAKDSTCVNLGAVKQTRRLHHRFREEADSSFVKVGTNYSTFYSRSKQRRNEVIHRYGASVNRTPKAQLLFVREQQLMLFLVSVGQNLVAAIAHAVCMRQDRLQMRI